MAIPNDSIDAGPADDATILSTPRSMEVAADEYVAWLDQATKLRDKAFRILQDRFIKDVEAELVGPIDPETLALQTEFATTLTADYLAESDKMFELMRKLAQSGGLESRHETRGLSVGNTQR
jgi:hypothetical protein